MTSHLYSPDPSGWVFLARSDLLLGIDLPVADERVESLWTLIDSGSPSAALLDEVTRGGISSTPAFVLVERHADSEVRVLARGGAHVRVVTEAGEKLVTGAGVSSWTEWETSLPAEIECVVDSAKSSGCLFPLSTGVVLSAQVRPGFSEEVTAAAPLRVVVPVESIAAPVPQAPPAAPDELTVAPEETVQPEAQTVIPDAPGPTPESSSGYDHLFGETQFRSVEDAAVREVEESTSVEEHTVVAPNMAELRAKRRAARATSKQQEPEVILYLDLSTGGRERLDQPIIIGRAPSATRISDGRVPRLVTMTTPNQDISRTHVQIVLEGGSVVVTDLHSRNGTLVTLPGKAPLKLRAGEPTVVIVGAEIDLGDGAVLTVGEGA